VLISLYSQVLPFAGGFISSQKLMHVNKALPNVVVSVFTFATVSKSIKYGALR